MINDFKSSVRRFLQRECSRLFHVNVQNCISTFYTTFVMKDCDYWTPSYNKFDICQLALANVDYCVRGRPLM